MVDAWKNDQAPASIEARLITLEELFELGYRHPNESDFDRFGIDTSTMSEEELEGLYASMNEEYIAAANTPTWVFNSNYYYWTMSQVEDLMDDVWRVEADGSLGADYVDIYNGRGVVRPVITLPKSVLKNS